MHKKNLKTALLVVFLAINCSSYSFADDMADFKAFSQSQSDGFSAQQKEFEDYKKALEAGFEAFNKAYQEEFAAYKNQIMKQWGEFIPATQKTWVSHVNNDTVRRSVDYETGKITVELLAGDKQKDSDTRVALEKEVYALLNSTESDAFKADTVAQRMEKRNVADESLIQRGTPGDQRLFSFDEFTSVVFNYSGLVKVKASEKNIVSNDVRDAKVVGKKIIRASFNVKKSLLQKAIKYADAVHASSEEHKIPSSLIYGIMESESSFNPMAKSHVPAYGLMQIVPRSAGKDATKHLFGKAKILAPSYLYSSDNNITIGAAYLHVLYYRYLRKVKDPQSRLYCAIAAYNTGASNVARAFIKTRNFNRAVGTINQMTSEEVYTALLKRLPFKETRNYVKKVSNRMQKYL